MKMVKKMVIAAAILPTVFATASVYAFGGKGGPGMGGDDFGGRCGADMGGMMGEITLTADQQAKLRELRHSHRDERGQRGPRMGQEDFAEMQAYRQNMQDLVLSDKFDQAKAEQLAKTMAERQVERRVERQVAMMKDRHDMLNVLTAEQKAQLKQIQADNWQHCQDQMGQGKGPGMGPGPGMGKAKN